MRRYYTIPFLVVFVFWIIFWIAEITYFDSWNDRGTFGDMFGAINSLFSGLAFAGIIITIILQSNELSLQRTELSLTRNEFRLQNSTLTRQRFENSFFNLLTIHHQTLEGLRLKGEYSGRNVFTYLCSQINRYIPEIKPDTGLDYLRNQYDHFSKQHYRYISHYIQSLHSLYEFIKINEVIPELEKAAYYRILKANISEPERLFLYYHITLGRSESAIVQTLRYMEGDLLVINSVPTSDLLHESHKYLIFSINIHHT